MGITEHQKDAYEKVMKLVNKGMTQNAALEQLGFSNGSFYKAKRFYVGQGATTMKKTKAKTKAKAPKVIDVEIPAHMSQQKAVVVLCDAADLKNVISNLF